MIQNVDRLCVGFINAYVKPDAISSAMAAIADKATDWVLAVNEPNTRNLLDMIDVENKRIFEGGGSGRALIIQTLSRCLHVSNRADKCVDEFSWNDCTSLAGVAGILDHVPSCEKKHR